LEELVKRLGDFFLQSGFESQFYGMSEMTQRSPWKLCAKLFCARCKKATCCPKAQ
jgi:hypothetical protein